MNDESLFAATEELSYEDKVRTVLFKHFSSNLMLVVAILFTISYAIQIISGVLTSTGFLDIVISSIIPVLIIIGLWKTYSNAKSGTVIDTSGLRLLKGVMTFFMVIIAIGVFGVAITMLLSFSLSTELALVMLVFLVTIVISLVTIISLRKFINSTIDGYQTGFMNTNSFMTTVVLLILAGLSGVGLLIFLTTFNWTSLIASLNLGGTEFEPLIEAFEMLASDLVSDVGVTEYIERIVSAAPYFTLGYFIYNLKQDLDTIY